MYSYKADNFLVYIHHKADPMLKHKTVAGIFKLMLKPTFEASEVAGRKIIMSSCDLLDQRHDIKNVTFLVLDNCFY